MEHAPAKVDETNKPSDERKQFVTDTKDIHFGMGLSATHIGIPARRDRLLFLAAFACVLLTMLGEAGERAGLDRYLKTNTSKKRTMSLYNQGCYWFMAIPRQSPSASDATACPAS